MLLNIKLLIFEARDTYFILVEHLNYFYINIGKS